MPVHQTWLDYTLDTISEDHALGPSALKLAP